MTDAYENIVMTSTTKTEADYRRALVEVRNLALLPPFGLRRSGKEDEAFNKIAQICDINLGLVSKTGD